MICIDNSEWMRNGDYSPSRFEAQTEAVNLICGAKTQVLGRDSLLYVYMRSSIGVIRVFPGILSLMYKKLWKWQSNPENTVGILTMAGKGVRVLATPTTDLAKILACMHGMP